MSKLIETIAAELKILTDHHAPDKHFNTLKSLKCAAEALTELSSHDIYNAEIADTALEEISRLMGVT